MYTTGILYNHGKPTIGMVFLNQRKLLVRGILWDLGSDWMYNLGTIILTLGGSLQGLGWELNMCWCIGNFEKELYRSTVSVYHNLPKI